MTDFNPYKILGIRRDSKLPRIKKAFRARAKETHPDLGGDRADFEAVQRAWFVLSDPDRRARYDKTGTIDETTLLGVQGQMLATLAELFQKALDGGLAWKTDLDLIALMKKEAKTQTGAARRAQTEITGEIQKLITLRRRFAKAGAGANVFHAVIDERINRHEQRRREAQTDQAVWRAVVVELDNYSCATDMAQQMQLFAFTGTAGADRRVAVDMGTVA